MAYATVFHVEAQTTRQFTASSKPQATQIVTLLDNVAAEIDSILRSTGFSLPVATTATSALELLEYYNALGVAARVQDLAPSGRPDDTVKDEWDRARAMLAAGNVDLGADKSADTSFARWGGSPTAMFIASQLL